MAISNRVDSQKTEAFSAERQLLTSALRSGWASGDGETEQRHTIRQLCTVAGDQPQLREHLLIAFRTIVIHAADEAQIPPGPKRNALLGRLATIFVEEFYTIPLAKRDGADGDHRDVA
ncbi:MAG: hypothetical protein ACJ79Q_06360 [Gemmatimonadaceae bacterium]